MLSAKGVVFTSKPWGNAQDYGDAKHQR